MVGSSYVWIALESKYIVFQRSSKQKLVIKLVLKLPLLELRPEKCTPFNRLKGLREQADEKHILN